MFPVDGGVLMAPDVVEVETCPMEVSPVSTDDQNFYGNAAAPGGYSSIFSTSTGGSTVVIDGTVSLSSTSSAMGTGNLWMVAGPAPCPGVQDTTPTVQGGVSFKWP